MASILQEETHWRMSAHYTPTLASKTSLIEESRLFLLNYAQTGDMYATSQNLLNGALPQRSRETRATIVKIIRARLVQWNPPNWVLADLVKFSQDTHTDSLKAALLLHTARQDALLYDFVQQVLVPNWQQGMRELIRSDVQSFLDNAQIDHPEVMRWSHSTREKLAGNILTILRDDGLLKGEVYKHIVVPIVPAPVAHHLVRLLQAEGIADEQLSTHSDWHIWLWETSQAQHVVDAVLKRENTSERTT